MKILFATTMAALLLAVASPAATAEETPAKKGPPVTMGDEPGKLPATGTVSGAVPVMTGPNQGSSSGDSAGTGLRMGDEPGKLPATGTVSGAVPEMRGPEATKK